MATTTYLTSNFGSGTDDGVGQKSTHSVWIKRTNPDDRSTIISGMNTNSSNYMKVRLEIMIDYKFMVFIVVQLIVM